MGIPQEAKHELKVPVVIKPDYTIYFERANGRTLIHCDVWSRWSLQVKRDLQQDFETLKQLHVEPIRALHNPTDKKHEKFLKLFGFTFEAFFISASNEPKELYKTQG